MRKALLALSALALAAGSTRAQVVAGEFSPNPAAPGDLVVLTLTDATGSGYQTSCDFDMLRQGSQNGPVVPLFQGCTGAVSTIGPHGTREILWDQTDVDGNVQPPGRYWFRARTFTSTTHFDWFCLSIQDPDDPALRVVVPPEVDGVAEFALSAPEEPFAFYVVLASVTSNEPLGVAGLDLCLSTDALLAVTLHESNPVFRNGIGLLDDAGEAAVQAVLPDDPSLAHQGFHLQALVETPSGLVTTNDLSVTVRP